MRTMSYAGPYTKVNYTNGAVRIQKVAVTHTFNIPGSLNPTEHIRHFPPLLTIGENTIYRCNILVSITN